MYAIIYAYLFYWVVTDKVYIIPCSILLKKVNSFHYKLNKIVIYNKVKEKTIIKKYWIGISMTILYTILNTALTKQQHHLYIIS